MSYEVHRREARWRTIKRFMFLVLCGCAVALTATAISVMVGGR